MTNPWLDIPEADYVGHMSSPAVGQRSVLGRLLGDVLEGVQPAVVLVLGGSTGNGLEHVNPAVTARVVVVIDINSTYLRGLRERFPNPIPRHSLTPRVARASAYEHGTPRACQQGSRSRFYAL